MIPKIIHQLWIGDKPPPLNIMNKWKEMNPNFEYMFWNEKLIKEKLNLDKKYIDKINSHIAIWGKADLYRYQILYKFGGIFIDADIIPIEPIDNYLLKKSFVCFEQEEVRKGLLATSVQGYEPNHIIPKTAIEWVLNNNINENETGVASWVLVGPGLLTQTYKNLNIPNCIDIKPSYLFLPKHHTGVMYNGHGKVYGCHEWGSTKNNYNDINNMDIPKELIKPDEKKNSIDIDITNLKGLDLYRFLKTVIDLEGNYFINIHYNNDDEFRSILLDWKKKTRWINIFSTIKNERSFIEL